MATVQLCHNMKRLSKADIESLMVATDKLVEVELMLSTVKHPAASGISVLVRDSKERVHRVAIAGVEKMQRIVEKQNDRLDAEARQRSEVKAAVARGMGEKE